MSDTVKKKWKEIFMGLAVAIVFIIQSLQTATVVDHEGTLEVHESELVKLNKKILEVQEQMLKHTKHLGEYSGKSTDRLLPESSK
jgi:hypothetical protein